MLQLFILVTLVRSVVKVKLLFSTYIEHVHMHHAWCEPHREPTQQQQIILIWKSNMMEQTENTHRTKRCMIYKCIYSYYHWWPAVNTILKSRASIRFWSEWIIMCANRTTVKCLEIECEWRKKIACSRMLLLSLSQVQSNFQSREKKKRFKFVSSFRFIKKTVDFFSIVSHFIRSALDCTHKLCRVAHVCYGLSRLFHCCV